MSRRRLAPIAVPGRSSTGAFGAIAGPRPIGTTFAVDRAVEAYAALDAHEARGKLVVTTEASRSCPRWRRAASAR